MSHTGVIEFLQNCLEYADASILRKEKRGDNEEIISE